MKKSALLLPVFFGLSLISFSQKKESYLEITTGPSIPVGNFSKKDLNNNDAGFAAPGGHVQIGYTYKFNHKFGIAASLLGQGNGADSRALSSEFGKQDFGVPFGAFGTGIGMPPTGPPSSAPVYYRNWSFEKHAWFSASLLIGGVAELPLNKKGNFSFIAKAMAGVINVKSPKLSGKSVTDTAAASATQNSRSAVGFTYLIRGGIRYNTEKNVSMIFAIDYTGTNKLTFKNVKSEFATAGTQANGLPSNSLAMRTGNVKQSLQNINLNVGVVFRL